MRGLPWKVNHYIKSDKSLPFFDGHLKFISRQTDVSGRPVKIGYGMSEKTDNQQQLSELHKQNALLEEKNRELIARIRVLSDENRSHEALIRALLESTPFGIVMFDAEHRLVQLNKAAESILGIERVSAIGISCKQVFGCMASYNEQCPVPGQLDVLDRVETCGCGISSEKTLLRSVVQIKSANEPVLVEAFVDISEIKRAQLEIENTNRLKDSFLSRISHELRTPLNSILGFAELLSDNCTGDEKSEERLYLNTIYNSGRDLLRMVDEILDITRISANRIKLDEYEVDVELLIQSVINKVKSEFPGKENEIVINPLQVKTIIVDQYRLHQVLYHLVHNAFKYTSGGKISISVDRKAGKIQFSIEDTGMGMSAEHIKRIFHEFEQVDVSYTRQHSGAGLGLSLCHHIMRLMGGELNVRSEPGKGSTFDLSLPDKLAGKLAI